MNKQTPIAAFDLGSQSFLCLIFSKEENRLNILFDDVRIVKISENLEKTKKISDEALDRAYRALTEFSEICNLHGVERKIAVATAFARDAKNSEEFLKICNQLQIQIEVISGNQEAELTFLGTAEFLPSSFYETDLQILIDTGGRSTELILFNKNKEILHRESFGVGGVLLNDQFSSIQAITTNTENQINNEILKTIKFQNFDKAIEGYKQKNETNSCTLSFAAVAGAPVELSMRIRNYKHISETETSALTFNEMKLFTEKMCFLTAKERVTKLGIHPGRSETLPFGAKIILSIMNYYKAKLLWISTKGIRYGLAVKYLQSKQFNSLK